ncbi:MAG: sarcosine oxidase subunit gamma family protein [Hyphomicrobiaceae bacterium]
MATHLTSPRPDKPAHQLTAGLGPAHHALTEITHRNEGLAVTGPGVEVVLSSGCPLPLDMQTFPPGRATRTLFAKAEIVLWRQTAESFHIEVARSFAPYLVALLSQAIADEDSIGQTTSKRPSA